MQGEGLGAEFLFPKRHTVLFGGHGVCLLLPGHIDSVRVAVAFGEGGLGGRTSVSLKVFGGILKASFGFLSGKHISACQKVFFWMYRKVPSGLCFARRVSVREDAPRSAGTPALSLPGGVCSTDPRGLGHQEVDFFFFF